MDTLKVYKIIWSNNVHTSFYIPKDNGGGIEVHQSIYPDNGHIYIIERERGPLPCFKLEEASPLNLVLIYGRTPESIIQEIERRRKGSQFEGWIQ